MAAALHILISGRVQGVGFRYACYAEARRYGLTGWVRNTADGDVEVWAEAPAPGPGEQPHSPTEGLDALLRWLHRGPPYARVDQVHCDHVQPTGAYPDFTIK